MSRDRRSLQVFSGGSKNTMSMLEVLAKRAVSLVGKPFSVQGEPTRPLTDCDVVILIAHNTQLAIVKAFLSQMCHQRGGRAQPARLTTARFPGPGGLPSAPGGDAAYLTHIPGHDKDPSHHPGCCLGGAR